MALSIFDRYITKTDSGETIPSAIVTVNIPNGGGLASLYSDRAGTISESNPFTADADGRATFYLDEGRYNITADDGVNPVINYSDVLISAEEKSAFSYDNLRDKLGNVSPAQFNPGDTVTLASTTTPGINGDWVVFQWLASSGDPAPVDNGGTIIVANSGTATDGMLYALRVYSGARNGLWFGAEGDGTTDAAAAIQAAIDSFGSGGGKVFLPAGVYIVGTQITINTGVTLFGPSDIHSSVTAAVYTNRSASIKQADGANLVSVVDIPSGSRNCSVRNLFIDGNRANNTAGYGLTSSGAVRAVRDVSIGSCPQVGLEHSGSYALFQNIVIADCDQQGLVVSGSDSYWQQVEVQNSDKSESGLYENMVVSGDDNVFDKIRSGMDTGSGTDGLLVSGSNNQFTHGVWTNNARHAAKVTGSNNQFAICTFSGATTANHPTASHAFYNTGQYNTASNCRFRVNAAGAYGAYLDSGSQYCDLDGDFTAGAAGSTFFVEGTVKDCQLTGKPKIGKIHGIVDININTSIGDGNVNANTGYFERLVTVTLPNSQFLNYPYVVSLTAKRANSGGTSNGDDIRILTAVDQTTTSFQVYIASTTNMQEYRIHWLADSSRGY